MENIKFEAVLVESAKLPMVKIDRELFLRKELRDRYSKETVEKAIQYNPAYAGLCVEDINKIAKSCITEETTKVTALSAAAGLPGGFIMIGTVPVDLAQYFGHILRILQKLIYLYGWHDLSLDSKEMNEETKNLLTLFVGIMFGVNGAVNTVNKLAAQVAKVVPVLGAAVSGGLTFVTFKPMSEKLRKYLASSELASVEYYKKMDDETVIDIEVLDDIKCDSE